MQSEQLSRIERKLDRALRYLSFLAVMEVRVGQELETLQAQVAKNEEVEQSAIVLIQGIAAQLAAAGQDPVKLKELSDGLAASADALAAAVAANTPAAPNP